MTTEQELDKWLQWVLYARSLGYDDWQARAWANVAMGWELSNADKFNLLPKKVINI
jgi:hypothetical protein